MSRQGLSDTHRMDLHRRAMHKAKIGARLQHSRAIVVYEIAEQQGYPMPGALDRSQRSGVAGGLQLPYTPSPYLDEYPTPAYSLTHSSEASVRQLQGQVAVLGQHRCRCSPIRDW